ncbi:MAG: Fe-S cluster assembly protein SufD, partial [Paludibacteraceae bacterium]|nr:Fe-S cluster assembly protein SufD [Paludibacteraceae bacterium]
MVEESYINIYNKHRELLQTTSAAPLDAIRDEAFDVFCRMGFPTDEQERYKRSNISDVFATEYGMNIRRIEIASTTAPYKCDVPGLKTHNFYVVNDIFAEAIAKDEIAELAKLGVVAGSLSTVAKEHPEIISKYYGKIAPHSSDVMVAFNTAFAQDGFVLYVPKNVQIERPIQLINMMHADFDLLATSRN